MQDLVFNNITVDKVLMPLFADKDVEVSVMRLDKIHPVISGNKWFKLWFYLEEAKQQKKKTIVTFGGAYSNHIVATAAACNLNGFKSVGIIRGEKAANLSFSLLQAEEMGMKFFFITREDYKKKRIPEQLQSIGYYLINEGGFGSKGVEGAVTILDHCKKNNFTHYCCAVGTGTMMAGLIRAALPGQKVIGISVMKNNFELEENVRSLLNEEINFQIIHEYPFGGYAKYKPALFDFMNDFFRQTKIPSDFVYTGKLFYAVNDLIGKNFFPAGSKLLVIHSGGLQGNASLNKAMLIF
jgi:1-aminocyclopropane-1-carboxylate deaminase